MFLNKSFLCMTALVSALWNHNIEAGTINQSETTFTHIYDYAVWGRGADGLGYSGGGSEKGNALPYLAFLKDFMDANHIESVVDFGCGDWTLSQHIDWKDIRYTGIDVVKSVIQKNQKAYGASTIQFIHGDEEALHPADLFICKDVLQHLSNEAVQKILNKLSLFKYCLITNDVTSETLSSTNQDIAIGNSRSIDLTQTPFNLKGVKVLSYPASWTIKQILLITRDDSDSAP